MQRDAFPSSGNHGEAGPRPGTLERGLAILEFFARRGQATPPEVVTGVGMSKSAAYRLLAQLQELGYLEGADDAGALRLGLKAAQVGMAAVAQVDVVRLAPPYLRDLVQRTSETAFLAVLDSDAMVYVHAERGPQPVQMSASIGSRRPLHSTGLGKAYLSALPQDARAALVAGLDLRPFTENTITDPAALLAELTATAERGFAVDDVEGEPGVACFAAPVRDHRGLPVAAISVAGPAARVLPARAEAAPAVRQTALDLSRRLGFRDPAHDSPDPGAPPP